MLKKFCWVAVAAVMTLAFNANAQGKLFELTEYEGKAVRGIKASDRFDVRVVYSETPKVVLQLAPEIENLYTMSLTNGVLEVGILMTEDARRRLDYDKQNYVVRLTVYTDQLNSIQLSDKASVTSTDPFKGGDLDIRTSAGSSVNLKYSGDKLKVSAKGSSKVRIDGEFAHADVQTAGTSVVGGTTLAVKDLKSKKGGKSAIEIMVKN